MGVCGLHRKDHSNPVVRFTINTILATLGGFYTPIRPRTLNAARLDLPKRARARDSVRSLRAVEG